MCWNCKLLKKPQKKHIVFRFSFLHLKEKGKKEWRYLGVSPGRSCPEGGGWGRTAAFILQQWGWGVCGGWSAESFKLLTNLVRSPPLTPLQRNQHWCSDSYSQSWNNLYIMLGTPFLLAKLVVMVTFRQRWLWYEDYMLSPFPCCRKNWPS